MGGNGCVSANGPAKVQTTGLIKVIPSALNKYFEAGRTVYDKSLYLFQCAAFDASRILSMKNTKPCTYLYNYDHPHHICQYKFENGFATDL